MGTHMTLLNRTATVTDDDPGARLWLHSMFVADQAEDDTRRRFAEQVLNLRWPGATDRVAHVVEHEHMAPADMLAWALTDTDTLAVLAGTYTDGCEAHSHPSLLACRVGAPRWWVRIERDERSHDLLVGPYPSEDDAAYAAANATLVDHLLSPGGGGGVDCYVEAHATGAEPGLADGVDWHVIDLTDPMHTGIYPPCRSCGAVLDEDGDGQHTATCATSEH